MQEIWLKFFPIGTPVESINFQHEKKLLTSLGRGKNISVSYSLGPHYFITIKSWSAAASFPSIFSWPKWGKKYANHFGVQTIITIIEATVIKFVYETS